MKAARVLGKYVEDLAKRHCVPDVKMCEILDCDEQRLSMFYKGRAFASFQQMAELAKTFGVSVSELLAGDNDSYRTTVVNCMNEFEHDDNREQILDIIYDYMDVCDAVDAAKSDN